MGEVRKFEYNGSEITFKLGNGDTMINLTEVAKAFPSKNLTNILNSKEMIEYLFALGGEDDDAKLHFYSLADSEYVKIVRGGVYNGTWAHQKVALRVAQKLSPRFAVWVDERLDELMRHGATAINPEDLLNPDYVISVMQALKKEREEKALLEAENRKNKPLVDFANTVAGASDAISMGEFAKVVYDQSKMGRNKLFQWLREQKILDKKNHPYQRYIDNGWFSVQEQTYTTPYGNGINLKTLVTGKGQISIIERVKAEFQ